MNVHSSQECCHWNVRFAAVAADPDDEGPTEAVIPTTDGPSLVDLMKMDEDEWGAFTRGSAIRRAGYAGLRRNVAVALVAALSDEDELAAKAAALALRRGNLPRT